MKERETTKQKKTMLNLRTMYREVVATLCILIKSAVFSLQSPVFFFLVRNTAIFVCLIWRRCTPNQLHHHVCTPLTMLNCNVFI